MAPLTISHLKGNTYYIPSPTNVGIYLQGEEAILIDSGNDKEAGRQINRLLNERGWKLKLIINTHSNADHIGGNAFLQDKTGCKIAATRKEAAFINDPILEASFLFGGYPIRDLKNKFLMAKESRVDYVIAANGEILDTGLEAVALPGHYFEMIGIKTPDHVFFIGDSMFSEHVINKYHLYYLLDIAAHLETLENIKKDHAEIFVPSHGEPFDSGIHLAEVNQAKIHEIAANIENFCRHGQTAEEVLQQVCLLYNIALNPTQYVLVMSTIRSYLAYLYEGGRVTCAFHEGRMVWQRP